MPKISKIYILKFYEKERYYDRELCGQDQPQAAEKAADHCGRLRPGAGGPGLKNATYVNVFSNELCTCDIAVTEGLIVGTRQVPRRAGGRHDGPHHPARFLGRAYPSGELSGEPQGIRPKAVLPHGTTTVITDPHEIANVMGTDGIEYMLQATEGLPVDVRFMLSSCVPATPLDESGANLDYRAIDSFYDHPRVQGLAEMMNFVGIINGDDSVVEKIVAAQAHHKKIDGHAPGLSGNDLNAYIAAGVYSDHECYTMDEAMEKLRAASSS
jgi:adenine deaminase